MADPILDELRQLDTCAVSDALDRLGLPGAIVGIRPLSQPKAGTIVGRALTVEVGPKVGSEPKPHLGAMAIVDGGPGDLIVIDNQGRTDVSSWGGILSHAAKRRGIAGVIVDGVCRDLDEAREMGFPVFARGSVPVSARGRLEQRSTGEPIHCAGVEVRPGDYVIADGSGVVVVEADRAGEVVALARRIADREERMVSAVHAGESVVDVMHDAAFDAITSDDL